MPSDPFPEHPDASKLFARKASISAVLPISRLQRFVACLPDSSGQVTVSLNFGSDGNGRRRLSGELSTRVMQVCQRCLQPMTINLDCNLDLLVLAHEDDLKELQDATVLATDVVVDEEDELDVLAIIEDELLLSLPLVPMHEDDSCNQALNILKQQVAMEAHSEIPPNPFGILATLKQTAGKDGQNS